MTADDDDSDNDDNGSATTMNIVRPKNLFCTKIVRWERASCCDRHNYDRYALAYERDCIHVCTRVCVCMSVSTYLCSCVSAWYTLLLRLVRATCIHNGTERISVHFNYICACCIHKHTHTLMYFKDVLVVCSMHICHRNIRMNVKSFLYCCWISTTTSFSFSSLLLLLPVLSSRLNEKQSYIYIKL